MRVFRNRIGKGTVANQTFPGNVINAIAIKEHKNLIGDHFKAKTRIHHLTEPAIEIHEVCDQ